MKNISFSEKGSSFNILKRLKLEVGKNPSILREAIFFSMLTWLPLLILSIIQNTAINPNIKIPFLYDYETYTRFLISLPALFIAEKFIKFETSNSLVHFINTGIISENNVAGFEYLVNKYRKLQHSKIIEVIIFVLAMVNIYLFKMLISNYGDVSSWKYFISDGTITLAGFWYSFISLPIYQFLVFRLLWKFILWSWFLWKISRMNLNLNASDPDGAGGLSFIGTAQASFAFLGFAQAASLSSEIANKVIYAGVPVDDFKFTTIIAILLAGTIYLCPLFFFCKKLTKLKLEGLLNFSVLTHKYSSMFEDKWIKEKEAKETEPLLGTGDIQSLADIGTSFGVIEDMRPVPLTYRIPLFMFLMIAIPFVPLITLKFPISEILKTLAGFLF